MGDFRTHAREVRKSNNSELRAQLAGRDDTYEPKDLKYVSNLCELTFREIDVDKDPQAYVEERFGDISGWGDTRTSATALRVLLTEQIGRPVYERISNVSKAEWADAIVAIDDGYVESGDESHVPISLPEGTEEHLTDPPNREESPAQSKSDISDFSDFESWVAENQPPDRSHAAYVVDCTPSIDDESPAIHELRKHTYALTQAGVELTKKTLGYDETKYRAARAANRCDRIYYIGETNDLVDRMSQHRAGADVGGSGFTNLVTPNYIIDICWCESKSDAKDLEQELVTEWNHCEGTFAFGS